MAVAMEALGDLLATIGPVVRLRTVPRASERGRLYHSKRAFLVGLTAARLLYLRGRCDVALFSADAGKGMTYVIALAWAARRIGYRVVVQHHSYAYIHRRSRLAAVLVRVCGPNTIHLYSCQLACDEFRRVYPRAVAARLLSVAYAATPPPQKGAPARPRLSRGLRLGHLSNLTIEKGLDEVIRFGRAAIQRGAITEVILAGPVNGRAERSMIDGIAGEHGFEYRGPVHGKGKEDFFRDVDVFIFPSRYRNELSPLVVWEAMLRGVPVIAYRAGCLVEAVLGAGTLVLDPDDDFTLKAMDRVADLAQSPEALLLACETSASTAWEERQRSISDALMLGAELFSLAPR